MVTQFNRKDIVSFGEYLLSEERTNRILSDYKEGDGISKEERLREVYHADVENWMLNRLAGSQRFMTGDRIETEGAKYECIMANRKLAVFGQYQINPDHTNVSYTNTFIVANDMEEDGFKFEMIK